MEAAEAKGTVTLLSSLFPVEDTQKAAKRVHDSLSEKNRELECLRGFISDNTNLINLVQRLPEELYHDVMVPFGKAAFFPGKLIHTNEFLVLLGEGYHAERTSKQTVEILKRRGKALDSHVESLGAMIEDLKTEASFFDTTASEAVEGLVDIREDYVEEESAKRESEFRNENNNADDKEYALMMSRLDELEKEELAAGSDYEDIEDEQSKALLDKFSIQNLLDDSFSEIDTNESRKHVGKSMDSRSSSGWVQNESQHKQDIIDKSNCSGLTMASLPKGEMAHSKSVIKNAKKLNLPEQVEMLPKVKENIQPLSSSSNEASIRSSNLGFDRDKAFTGSIMERSNNVPKEETSTSSQQIHSSQPSKPVSRFKMQRR